MLSLQHPWVRYVSDSSHSLHIAHLPPVIVGRIPLHDANRPAFVKLTINVAACTVALLASYHWLVRYTWMGRLLNGPRTRPSRT